MVRIIVWVICSIILEFSFNVRIIIDWEMWWAEIRSATKEQNLQSKRENIFCYSKQDHGTLLIVNLFS